jgi:hypothetical protein
LFLDHHQQQVERLLPQHDIRARRDQAPLFRPELERAAVVHVQQEGWRHACECLSRTRIAARPAPHQKQAQTDDAPLADEQSKALAADLDRT